MWYHFFKFEITYRIRRPETYLCFLFLLLFSLFGVEFVFQGIDLGLVKKNSPLVIAKTMAAITLLFMIIASMIMGVPILRDHQYETQSLIYANPIAKKDYLLGHFLGSYLVLIFIFSGMIWGMALGGFMPWTKADEYLPFELINYFQPFLWVALPSLTFGAAVFFISSAFSKNLILVYTQAIFIFVIFMLTKGIENPNLQALLDPFSITTLTKATENWTIYQRNHHLIPVLGIMLKNKLFWLSLGVFILIVGYFKFKMAVGLEKTFKRKQPQENQFETVSHNKQLPETKQVFHSQAQFKQLLLSAWFHSLSILKLSSFWAIIVCCFIIIYVNSLSLGTAYDVDSYPTSYLIVEELKEMSLYFFAIILIFYTAEIMWKEKEIQFDLIHDSTPIHHFINLGSKLLALVFIYVLLLLSLILAGITFQVFHGYDRFDLNVYFFGFFLDLIFFLVFYTLAALFFQTITKNKFLGILGVLIFGVINVANAHFGIGHVLLEFGGQTLGKYSDMNGYGHFLDGYLWVKAYWLLFGVLILFLASKLKERRSRWSFKKWLSDPKSKSAHLFVFICLLLFAMTGGFIFYNTNVLNDFWTEAEKNKFRVGYEKTLKQFEYIPQPKIIATHLKIDLFPSKRSYEIDGEYVLTNTFEEPIQTIHIQKIVESHVELSEITFDRKVSSDSMYAAYDYIMYKLDQPLSYGDTMKMAFKQILAAKGFDMQGNETEVVYNGTFFDNTALPGFGYQKKYEIQDEDLRLKFDLVPRIEKADRTDQQAVHYARSGSDSKGLFLDVIISTEAPQTALTSGELIGHWNENGRNYFHYQTDQKIIHFYPFLSANYEVFRDSFNPNRSQEEVKLEIYHHKGHEYNLSRMMKAMKMSLDYYGTHFSPYPYKHLRIAEFPRYNDFAQSLPGIIPFSESLGFIMHIQDQKDVDMAFYITAHEVAHQWWGMQLEAAHVKGQNMILETLSQYGAMMVFRSKYSNQKMQQFLNLQKDAYKKTKLKSRTTEPPLALVESQSHIYYNKGALAMYEWMECIGEVNVNKALSNFLFDWHSFGGAKSKDRYATTLDLLQYFRAVTPDDQHYLIGDIFECGEE
ncbi:MAG: M1 family aminopeptidase [Saprospiraceae bacterium]